MTAIGEQRTTCGTGALEIRSVRGAAVKPILRPSGRTSGLFDLTADVTKLAEKGRLGLGAGRAALMRPSRPLGPAARRIDYYVWIIYSYFCHRCLLHGRLGFRWTAAWPFGRSILPFRAFPAAPGRGSQSTSSRAIGRAFRGTLDPLKGRTNRPHPARPAGCRAIDPHGDRQTEPRRTSAGWHRRHSKGGWRGIIQLVRQSVTVGLADSRRQTRLPGDAQPRKAQMLDLGFAHRIFPKKDLTIIQS